MVGSSWLMVNDGRTGSLWTTGHDNRDLWQNTTMQHSMPALDRLIYFFWGKIDCLGWQNKGQIMDTLGRLVMGCNCPMLV